MNARRGDGGAPPPAGGAHTGFRLGALALLAALLFGALRAAATEKPVFGVVPQDGAVPPAGDKPAFGAFAKVAKT